MKKIDYTKMQELKAEIICDGLVVRTLSYMSRDGKPNALIVTTVNSRVARIKNREIERYDGNKDDALKIHAQLVRGYKQELKERASKTRKKRREKFKKSQLLLDVGIDEEKEAKKRIVRDNYGDNLL